MSRPVFLVGSMPYEPREALQRASATLAGLVDRIPDGELKGWLPTKDFQKMPDVTIGRGESISVALPPTIPNTLRAREGVDPASLNFNTLHYLENAITSYDIFQHMKAAGTIGQQVRFQISIPTPFTGLICWDWDQLRDVWPVYEAALIREVYQICEAIPLTDLAISWDACELLMSLANPHAPDGYSMDELAASVARCLNAVPLPAETGLHFCYGGYNSAGTGDDPLNRAIDDTSLMVDFFHAICAKTTRPINWLHMPVPMDKGDDAFFAPLANLNLSPETTLFLGLVYLDDGMEITRKKIAAASRYVPSFGVAAACGLNNPGARTRTRTAEMLEYHRAVAEQL